eukprot:525696_1
MAYRLTEIENGNKNMNSSYSTWLPQEIQNRNQENAGPIVLNADGSVSRKYWNKLANTEQNSYEHRMQKLEENYQAKVTKWNAERRQKLLQKESAETNQNATLQETHHNSNDDDVDDVIIRVRYAHYIDDGDVEKQLMVDLCNELYSHLSKKQQKNVIQQHWEFCLVDGFPDRLRFHTKVQKLKKKLIQKRQKQATHSSDVIIKKTQKQTELKDREYFNELNQVEQKQIERATQTPDDTRLVSLALYVQQQQQQIVELQKLNQSMCNATMQAQNQNIRVHALYNDLFVKYAVMKREKVHQGRHTDCSEFVMWTWEDVLVWLLTLDNGRYVKYKDKVIPNIRNNNISGLALTKMSCADWNRVGVTDFSDQGVLIHHTQTLVALKNQNELQCSQEGQPNNY